MHWSVILWYNKQAKKLGSDFWHLVHTEGLLTLYTSKCWNYCTVYTVPIQKCQATKSADPTCQWLHPTQCGSGSASESEENSSNPENNLYGFSDQDTTQCSACKSNNTRNSLFRSSTWPHEQQQHFPPQHTNHNNNFHTNRLLSNITHINIPKARTTTVGWSNFGRKQIWAHCML